eukprot:NODE_667_length_5369_cov_0.301518.p1 type:complete len:556 gc:universal NODE_667_length_5369_cov_0.301518:2139-472(-)
MLFLNSFIFASNCGANIGTCTNNQCCSSGGFCGLSAPFCLSGCQSSFGQCGKISGICDVSLGNLDCPSNQCCSPSGFCGTGSEYCSPDTILPSFSQCKTERQIHLSITTGSRTRPYVNACLKLNIPCSFFIIPDNYKNNADTDYKLSYIATNNMSIGLQYPIGEFDFLSKQQIINKIESGRNIIYNLTGQFPSLFRPYLTYKNETIQSIASDLQMLTIFLNVDAQEYLYNFTQTEEFFENLISKSESRKSIIMSTSDSNPLFLNKMGKIYNYFSYRNFEFVNATECALQPIPQISTANSSPPAEGLCGPLNFNRICPDGQCCSQLGYCGTSNPHCYENLKCASQCKGKFGLNKIELPQTDVVRKCLNKKHVSLTIDDAPSSNTVNFTNTLNLLDLPATFFVSSAQLLYNNVSAILNSSRFEIGLKDNWTISNDFSTFNATVLAEIQLIYDNSTLKKIEYIRPTYNGYDNKSISGWNALESYAILYDIDAEDWQPGATNLTVYNKVQSQLLADDIGGHIITCGSEANYCVDAIGAIKSLFLDSGYTFVNMSTCLGL